MKVSRGREGDGGGGRPNAASTSVKCDRKSIDERFRDYIVRTNMDVVAVGLLLACYHAQTARAEPADGTIVDHDRTYGDGRRLEQSEGEAYAEEETAVYSVLFPWFTEIVGVFVYFLLSRYLDVIPFTAIMFIVGVFIGFSSKLNENAISFSASTWAGMQGELILLVFLPGLLFLDSYNLDTYLVTQTFFQNVYFAFPMMLAGTALTALVGYYILPYGWSFDLCMTFGSILSATDPVSVAVLMNELGAPPRLKVGSLTKRFSHPVSDFNVNSRCLLSLQVHISGESIMNDGSAAVFYQIFSARYLYSMGVQGVGDNAGWGEGFEKFFRLSLGGACIGVIFGFGMVIVLYSLNRRLSGDDSIVQVVATISVSYLAYFTSEVLSRCSGIIAVFAYGVTVKAFGETLYNDSHLFQHFWEITEFLLNSLLFTLAGCVWAFVVDNENTRWMDVVSGRVSILVFQPRIVHLKILLVCSVTGLPVGFVYTPKHYPILLDLCKFPADFKDWNWNELAGGVFHELWRLTWSCGYLTCPRPPC
jgi:NhaP-type Na+/H+ or K+/H+ antiporter